MKLGRGTSNHMLKISHVANVVYLGNPWGATRATQSIATSWGKCVIKQSDPPKKEEEKKSAAVARRAESLEKVMSSTD